MMLASWISIRVYPKDMIFFYKIPDEVMSYINIFSFGVNDWIFNDANYSQLSHIMLIVSQ